MKKTASLILFIALLGILSVVYSAYGDTSDSEKCLELLRSYGWKTQNTPDSSADITIPATFDKVYENYNILQKNSGLDLSPYRGKKGTRYTFIITNYPVDTGETVYANVIAIDGNAVGGDIMTVSLSGFMHGLGENNPLH